MIAAMTNAPRAHRISIAEYYRMAEVGLLAPDARVELIDGVIVDMPPPGPQHCAVTAELYQLFQLAVQNQALVRCRNSMQLLEFSEPQPDLLLVKYRADRYRKRHPGPEDAFLVVEVSDSTLRYDLGRKRALYAAYGIPEYWVVDLQKELLRTFSEPVDGVYAMERSLTVPCTIAPRHLPRVSIDLTGLFG